MPVKNKPLVRTIPEVCRVCYTCVRECPAKAIRILHGQAAVVEERCIGCGNCVRVCSQNAKEVADSISSVKSLLSSKRKTAAMVAPSFPAEFTEDDYRVFVGMLRGLGFDKVVEVAAGADLVAAEYRRLLDADAQCRYIATTCPAIVSYVEFYHPSLVGNLIPVVSPMIAAARAVRAVYGQDYRVVFIGPCIAKKAEARDADLPDAIDAVMTFAELRRLLHDRGVSPARSSPSDFDPPHAGGGRLFPLAKGLLEAAGIREDLVTVDVVATDGREGFIEAIKEFELGYLSARLLEVLCCQGCIMGAGMSRKLLPVFQRRSLISAYVRRRLSQPATGPFAAEMRLDLSRRFSVKDRRLPLPSAEAVNAVLGQMGKSSLDDELNCGACGYESCREHAVAICKGNAEIEMCLPYAIDLLKVTVQKLADTSEEVAVIQNALLQSEKLAGLGQLAAGVAHEVNNPLGIVLMHAHLLLEQYSGDKALGEDLAIIAEQADRCKRIISGLLNFARQNQTVRAPTDLVKLTHDTIRSVNLSKNIKVVVESGLADPIADIDPDQITQAMINLFTNAQAAMPKKGRLTVGLSGDENTVVIRVSDTGVGIAAEHLPKIFDPFFTTKQIGKGTGLGLAVLYGIVKMHRGRVTVKSNTDPAKGETGTAFSMALPRHAM